MNATKVCTKCLQEVNIDDFPWKSKLLNKRHSVCKPCMAKRSKGWYEKNKVAHIENVMVHKQEARDIAREFVWDYLSSHPCKTCGESDPTVLEFHHVHGKEKEVSRMVADGLSIAAIQREINKCDVLCANCHRRLTSYNRGWFRKNIS